MKSHWNILEPHCPSNIQCRIKKKTIYPLVICYIAIENGPVEIVSFPMNSMVDLSHQLCNKLPEGVNPYKSLEIPSKSPWFPAPRGSDACDADSACTGSTPRAHWTLVLRAGDHGQSSSWNDRLVTWAGYVVFFLVVFIVVFILVKNHWLYQ